MVNYAVIIVGYYYIDKLCMLACGQLSTLVQI